MEPSQLEQTKVMLGRRINQLRTGRKLSLRKLAVLAGLEHPQLVNIEKGRLDMKLSTLTKIAVAFEMDLSDLLRLDA